MLTQTNIQTAVNEEIGILLLEDQSEVDVLTGHEQLHDLGLNSLMFARLIIQLEAVLGVDPFVEEGVMIWDVRSVDDLVALYQRASVMAQWPCFKPVSELTFSTFPLVAAVRLPLMQGHWVMAEASTPADGRS